MSLTLDVGGAPVPILGVAVLGVIVGYVAGMFGIGGGFLMTPLLVVLFGVPLPFAVGTGLCQMIGTALVSLLRHLRLRQGERRFDLLLLPGCLLGVTLGARTLSFLAQAGSMQLLGRSLPWVTLIVQGSYALLLLFVAWNYWRHGRSGGVDVLQQLRPGPLSRWRLGPSLDLPAVGLRSVSALVLAKIGLAVGFRFGLVGRGGGVAVSRVL
jgi:uncharacterized membrane protein YfcA